MKRIPMLLAVLLLTACAHHNDRVATGSWAGVQFQEENDTFARFDKSDEHYTQALRATKTVNPVHNPRAVKWLARNFCEVFCQQLQYVELWTVGWGQAMYTPVRIDIRAPQPNDRPFAGWLYAVNTLQITDRTDDPRMQHVIDVQTGVVGPSSGAAFAQGVLHAAMGWTPNDGWKYNQLGDQFGINVIYAHNYRWAWKIFDLTTTIGGSGGNVMSYVNGGANLRIGKDITGFLHAPLRATAGTRADNRAGNEYYVYGGIERRQVFHNLFLGDHEMRDHVTDLMFGASYRRGSWRVTYNHVQRSPEFDHPDKPDTGDHNFGSIIVAWEPRIRLP